jgi:hypothetical protein
MGPADQTWIENRVHAAVDDDFYLDREEEKRIKEEAAAKGISIKDTEVVLRTELEKVGAACERVLLDELDRLLHQFTDNDRRLDSKEERTALQKVLAPASGKKKGLDPRVAQDYVNSFCSANGVRRDTQRNRLALPLIAVVGVLLAGIFTWFVAQGGHGTAKESAPAATSDIIITAADKQQIDDQLRRARLYLERAQYTDPPEASVKACLDAIHLIDPKGSYRGSEVRDLADQVVDHYLKLADASRAHGDRDEVVRWLERAKLMGAATETIRERERRFGLIPAAR